MTVVQLTGQHRGKYVVYDDKGKIVIVTRNKNIALHYEQTTMTAA
jgi:regulatory protein YycI of two-component signal transduction system YycFG